MDRYVVKKSEIEAMEGLRKQHFLNANAQRINKSLGDLTGITGFGFHVIEVSPGKETTEFHVHYCEDECVFVLAGTGRAVIGDETFDIAEGDFIGYRAGGKAHSITNTGDEILKCIVVGQRLDHDVGEYPNLKKRLYRIGGRPWEIVDLENIDHPSGSVGKK